MKKSLQGHFDRIKVRCQWNFKARALNIGLGGLYRITKDIPFVIVRKLAICQSCILRDGLVSITIKVRWTVTGLVNLVVNTGN